jgi:allantoin racemase
MKIMVINPNTSKSMTENMRRSLLRIKRKDTELAVTCPDRGPETIDSSYDAALVVPPTLQLVQKANVEDFDAVIIAAFSDPGLEAAREISNILVLGIEEVSLHMAAMLGAKFTVLTPIKNRIPHKYKEVQNYKLDPWLASVRTTDMTVAETDANPELAKLRILEAAHKAVEQDGAEIIILGCAAMVGYHEDISRELGVVVLDPTTVTLKICEALLDAKLSHSKKALFASPPIQ